jgi:hypothetical protein
MVVGRSSSTTMFHNGNLLLELEPGDAPGVLLTGCVLKQGLYVAKVTA